jgi:hypothetical protein
VFSSSVFVSSEGIDYDIYVTDADNEQLVNLTPGNDSDDIMPDWQPVVVYNQSPTADAGPDQIVTDSDGSGSGNESVALDGSASSDSDGSIVSYVWTLDGVEIATGATPTVDLAVGVHTITLTVTDDDGATGSDEVVITVSPPAASATLTFQVASAADDVNEDGSAFTPDDPLIWIGTGASASGSYTGLRFTGVAIPPGATIAAAYVEFHNPQPAWITVGLELAAEAADDSAAFSSSSRPSQRPLTVERVQHNSDLHWQGGDWHALDDISAVLQEVVDRPGWHSGSSLSVILHGTDSPFGRKYVSSYESDPAHAPRLVVRLLDPASVETPLYRVNAGGPALDTAAGAWIADDPASGYVNTGVVSVSAAGIRLTHPSVPVYTPMAVFQTERWDEAASPELQWVFPVTNGSYEVRLYFAETWDGAFFTGGRRFDVWIEGALVLDDYDVFADVGANTGVVKTFTTTVSDGALTIDFGHVVDDPSIKGIEVFALSGAN